MYKLLFLNIGFPELVLIVFFLLIPLLLIIFSLIDIFRSRFSSSTIKFIWAGLVIFMPVLGAVLYLLVGRTKKIES